MPPVRAPSPTRDDLTLMLMDVLAWSLMVGLGETHLTPFALALGVGESVAGLVSTVPVLVGSLLQWLALPGVRHAGSLRRWVVACVVVQALCYLPLAAAGFRGSLPTAAFFGIASVYWAAALSSGPVWNTWVEFLVPARLRAAFFARRGLFSQLVLVSTLLGSGWVLREATAASRRLEAFATLFLLAALGRLVSAALLHRHRDAPLTPDQELKVPLRELFRRSRRADDGRLVAYLLASSAAVHVSAPYFAPFLLAQMHLDYLEWVTILAAPYAARIVVLPYWGRIARRQGARRLLWIGAIGIVPLPFLWTLSSRMGALVLVALWSGATWAAQEHGSFLLFFDTMRSEERTSILTSYNLARAFAMVGGSLVGAAWLRAHGENFASYAELFWLASALRIGALVLLARVGRGEPVGTERRRPGEELPALVPRVGVPLTAAKSAPR